MTPGSDPRNHPPGTDSTSESHNYKPRTKWSFTCCRCALGTRDYMTQTSSSIHNYCTDSTNLICITSVWIQINYSGIGLFMFVFSSGTEENCFWQLICNTPWYSIVKNSFAWYSTESRLGILVIAVSLVYNLTEFSLWRSSVYNRISTIHGSVLAPVNIGHFIP